MRGSRVPSLRALALIGAAAVSMGAQSTGVTTADLSGRVHGSDGRAIPGAKLLLIQEATRLTRSLVADAQGGFRFQLVPVGLHTLRVEAAGFQPRQVAGLVLVVGSAHRLEVGLLPENQATVEVRGEAPSLEIWRTQPSALVDEAALRDLPIDRRDFTSLSLITPYAVGARLPVNSAAPDSGLSFAGAGPRQNSFRVDGLDNNDLGNGNLRITFSQEAIREFQVIAGGGSAEYGRALGGILNAVTKSGTNATQGSLFAFRRSGDLDADPGAASLRTYQFGATLGGALVKDRLFYFLAVERLDLRDRNDVGLDPFVAQAILGSGFTVANGPQATSEANSSIFGRLDWTASAISFWTFTAVRSLERNDRQIPWGGLVAQSSGGARETANLALALSHQWLPAATLVNEARVLYTTRDNRLGALDAAGTVQVEIQGAATFGTQRLTPQATLTTYQQVMDTLTWSHGSHTVKGGVDLLESHNRGTAQQNFSGYYLFTAIPQLGINSSLAAFLAPNPFGGTGLPAAFLQAFGHADTDFRTGSQSCFLQDEWQPTPSFLLRVGLRYDRERIPPFPNTADFMALANPPATVDPIYGPTLLPNGPYAYADLLRPSLDWSRARLLPRVAFSWQASKPLRFFGGFGSYAGTTNLALIFGNRLINGTDQYGILRTLLDPLSQGPWIAWANGDGLAANHRYAAPPPGLKVLAIPGTYGMPLQHQQNLGLEWQTQPDMRFFLDLLHARAAGLLTLRDVNAFVPYGPGLRRPDLRYASIYRTDGSGESRFRSASLGWEWAVERRCTLKASYTWSRAEDNVTDWATTLPAQNTFDPASEFGPSYPDQRHRLLASGILRSPSGDSPWLRNWTLAFTARLGSGHPYSRLLGYDANQNGDPASDRPAGYGRNSETTPWTRAVDLRLSRSFLIEATRLELVLDCFNLFNTGNAAQVQNSLASQTPPYGTPLTFEPRRQIQFGMRVSF